MVTFTTHKTLRGPRAGCILTTAEHATAIDKAVFPGLQGGPLMHVIAAKAVAFREAAQPAFRDYAAAHRAPTPRPWPRRWRGRGSASCRAAPTTTSCSSTCAPSTPSSPARWPRTPSTAAGITLNKNPIPNDPRSPFVTSGLRIGTAAVTTAGMGEPEMGEIASLIGRALRQRDRRQASWPTIRDAAATLCSKFTPYPDD